MSPVMLRVQKAVESANTTNTVLIGDDTDLLILLIYHTNLELHGLFFKTKPKKSTNRSHVWNIKAIKSSSQEGKESTEEIHKQQELV